jgi:hypothetical protein
MLIIIAFWWWAKDALAADSLQNQPGRHRRGSAQTALSDAGRAGKALT